MQALRVPIYNQKVRRQSFPLSPWSLKISMCWVSHNVESRWTIVFTNDGKVGGDYMLAAVSNLSTAGGEGVLGFHNFFAYFCP